MGKIIILGANGSVGKSTTDHLSKKDLDLELISRNSEELEINASATKSSFKSLDISDFDSVRSYINDIDFEIDGILFAVGSISLKPFSVTSSDDFLNVYKQNFLNPVNFLNLSIDKLSNNSSVVFFSTVAAQSGFKQHTAIASAKSALLGLSISLAAEYSPKIRFNCISPSLIKSKMSSFITDSSQMTNAIAKLHPMGRIGVGNDAGSLASFLLSSESSWITGQNFNVDGGRSNINTR
ncbi:MAG: hypothetical protein CMI90_04910 [Pelagibacteraceae bacterium]|nr:hypothetical protein [Pelagibacteraceae bacterium]|tara:strand:+ start:1545 stop:2258 length:714 start_codon:yes stop_codon:yes gene_type:complete